MRRWCRTYLIPTQWVARGVGAVMKPEVEIYDTTLRDGSQGEGINFSVMDKLRIAEKLDAFGVHYIEGGWPGSNPKDIEFFAQAKRKKFKRARLAAFGSTRRKDIAAGGRRPGAAAAGGRNAGRHHLWQDLAAARQEGPAHHAGGEPGHDRATRSGFLKEHGKFVVYDAEHAFDGYKDDAEYALATWQAAEKAGADIVVLCDTNGGTLPGEIAEHHRGGARRNCAGRIGIHTHDDVGLGRGQRAGGARGGRDARPGDDQRLRRAHRQLQPHQRHPQRRVQDGQDVRAGSLAAAAQGAFAVRG